MKAYYEIVTETGSYSMDGRRAEVGSRCGHHHRTLRGAVKCKRRLQKRNADGSTSAKWYHARVYDQDGRVDQTEVGRVETELERG